MLENRDCIERQKFSHLSLFLLLLVHLLLSESQNIEKNLFCGFSINRRSETNYPGLKNNYHLPLSSLTVISSPNMSHSLFFYTIDSIWGRIYIKNRKMSDNFSFVTYIYMVEVLLVVVVGVVLVLVSIVLIIKC